MVHAPAGFLYCRIPRAQKLRNRQKIKRPAGAVLSAVLAASPLRSTIMISIHRTIDFQDAGITKVSSIFRTHGFAG